MICLSSPKTPLVVVALWANTPVKYYGGLPPFSPYRSVFAVLSVCWCSRRSPTPKSATLYSRPPKPCPTARASPALRVPAPTRLRLGRQSPQSLAAGVFSHGGAASGLRCLPPLAGALGSQSPCARAGTSNPQPTAPAPCAACTCGGTGCNSAPSPLSPSPPRGGGACNVINFMVRYRWVRVRRLS